MRLMAPTTLKCSAHVLAVLLIIQVPAAKPGSASGISTKESVEKYYEQAKRDSRNGYLDSIDKPIAELNAAIQLDPKCYKCYLLKAQLLWDNEENDKDGLEAALAAIKLRPGDALPHQHAGQFLVRLGRLDEALKQANEAVRVSPNNDPNVFGLKAHILMQKKDVRSAEKVLTQGLNIFPKWLDLLLDRAYARFELHDYAGVIQDAKAIIAKQVGTVPKKNREARLLLARSYIALKDEAMARKTYLDTVNWLKDDRISIVEAKKYFESIGDKKNADLMTVRLKSMDQDYIPLK